MNVLFRPHPGPQTRFMQWTGRYALIGGAAFGGKSECLRWDVWRQILVEQERKNRGEITSSTGRAIFFRRTMPELREVMDRCQADFKLVDPGAVWHEQTKTWTMSCGYKYMFGQMEEEKDWTKYQGFQFTWVGFDELTSFTEEQFDKLDVWLRSKDPVLSKMLSMRAGTNPIGPGLIWVRSRFFDVAPPGTPVVMNVKVTVEENGVKRQKTIERRQIFIPARVSDNLSVDEGEFAATLSTKSAATRRALLYGDWYAGAEGVWVGDDWDPEVHVCEPFKIPPGWPKFRMGDYGYSWPGLSSVQWGAVDTDGNIVIYRSLTTSKQNAEMLAHRIKEIEMDAGEWDVERGCSKLRGPLDSSCWNQTGAIGPTIAESFFNVGVIWDKCDKNREAAAEQVRQRLVRRTAHPTVKDEKGKPAYIVPGIRWFDTCWSHVLTPKGRRVKVGPVITIPTLQADEHQPDVPDTKGNDHDYDAACLTADTEVLTEFGPIPIGLMAGASGWTLSTDGRAHPFLGVTKTRTDAPLVRVDLEDGYSFTCTPDHRILLSTGEWKNAGEMDTSCYAFIPCSPESFLERSKSLTANATGCAAGISSTTANAFTVQSGNGYVDQFRMGSTSTIWTATGQTTQSQTSNASRDLSTTQSTGANSGYDQQRFAATSLSHPQQQRNGTAALQASAGIQEMLARPGSYASQTALHAQSAGGSTRPSLPASIALERAARRLEETAAPTTSSEFALPVGERFWRAGMRVKKPAHGHAVRVSAVTPAGSADVYCLTVPGMGAFALANGVIVSNSYGCMSRPLVADNDKTSLDEIAERRKRQAQSERTVNRLGYPVGAW